MADIIPFTPKPRTVELKVTTNTELASRFVDWLQSQPESSSLKPSQILMASAALIIVDSGVDKR